MRAADEIEVRLYRACLHEQCVVRIKRDLATEQHALALITALTLQLQHRRLCHFVVRWIGEDGLQCVPETRHADQLGNANV